MKNFYLLLTIFLIPIFLIHSSIVFAEESVRQYHDIKITPSIPETWESEPLDVLKPVEVSKSDEKPVSKWWYLIGAAVLVGVVAASGGIGGGSAASGGGGTITATW